MKKLKAFFYVFKNSASRPAYYQDVLKAPFSFSLKYFLFFFFILGFLTSATLSFFLVQKVQPYINKIKIEAPNFYPADLVITIKDGQTSTNVVEPFFVPLKPELFPPELEKAIKQQPVQNILVIDTSVEPTEIKKYQTFVLLTKESVAFIGDQNEIRIQSLEEVKDFTLNREIVETAWQEVVPYFGWIVPAIIVFLFLALPAIIIIGKFIYLAVFSCFSWIIARIMKLEKVNYSKALQINLQAITLPTIVISAFQFLGADPQIPFFQSIILLFFVLIIFTSIKEKAKK